MSYSMGKSSNFDTPSFTSNIAKLCTTSMELRVLKLTLHDVPLVQIFISKVQGALAMHSSVLEGPVVEYALELCEVFAKRSVEKFVVIDA